MQIPETRYTKTVDGLHIAYQVVGDGPVDLPARTIALLLCGTVADFMAREQDRRRDFAAYLDHTDRERVSPTAGASTGSSRPERITAGNALARDTVPS